MSIAVPVCLSFSGFHMEIVGLVTSVISCVRSVTSTCLRSSCGDRRTRSGPTVPGSSGAVPGHNSTTTGSAADDAPSTALVSNRPRTALEKQKRRFGWGFMSRSIPCPMQAGNRFAARLIASIFVQPETSRTSMPNRSFRLSFCFGVFLLAGLASGRVVEIHPAIAAEDEEFERLANALQPGDELVLHGGTYSQAGRRAITAKGTAEKPILIRAAQNESPLLSHSPETRARQNTVEFVDCAHLVIRGLRFQGGSSGVRFIRVHHLILDDYEIFETGNSALTMNSGNCHAFVLRRNHIRHTGLAESGATEGEGMY